jgi:hypothetical protein
MSVCISTPANGDYIVGPENKSKNKLGSRRFREPRDQTVPSMLYDSCVRCGCCCCAFVRRDDTSARYQKGYVHEHASGRIRHMYR